VLSNHQAPSRDIAAKFADLDRVKHILSGGYWFDKSESTWVRAGKDVQRILRNTPIIQRHLGWAPPPIWTPGLIKAVAQKKQAKFGGLTAEEAMLANASNPSNIAVDSTKPWTNGVNVTTASGDDCTVGSWAVFRVHNVSHGALEIIPSNCYTQLPMVARVSKILLPKGSKSAQGILVVSRHNVGEALHPHYRMPILLPDAAGDRIIVPSDVSCFSGDGPLLMNHSQFNFRSMSSTIAERADATPAELPARCKSVKSRTPSSTLLYTRKIPALSSTCTDSITLAFSENIYQSRSQNPDHFSRIGDNGMTSYVPS
jgi:hypothetical protein